MDKYLVYFRHPGTDMPTMRVIDASSPKDAVELVRSMLNGKNPKVWRVALVIDKKDWQ